jgi:hypothetical protein
VGGGGRHKAIGNAQLEASNIVAEMNPKKSNIIQSASRIWRERKLICKPVLLWYTFRREC